jgi:hypothetical protein
MALTDSINNNGSDNNEEKELVQFEQCQKGEDSHCRFKDTNGRCIFETCIVENELPPTTLLWYFECIACCEVDTIKPEEMKIHFCKGCIEQLQKAQKLPFTCILCGSSQGSRGKGFGNQICDTCISKLAGYMKKYGTGAHC